MHAYLLLIDRENTVQYHAPLTNNKEYKNMELYLLGYSILDLFEDIKRENRRYYFHDILNFLDDRSSMLLLPSGYKIILVHDFFDASTVKNILLTAHEKFKELFLNDNLEYEKIKNEILKKL